MFAGRLSRCGGQGLAEGTKFLSVAVDETSLKLPNGIARRPEAFCGGFCGEFDVSADLDMLTSCMEYGVQSDYLLCTVIASQAQPIQ